MSTYQVIKNGAAITGALTYVEALQKENTFKRADVDNMASYSVDIFMPSRPVVRAEDVPAATEEEDNTMERMEALAKHLGIELEEGETWEDHIEEAQYPSYGGYFELTAEGNDYLVLTDEEADKAASDYIADSLWAFSASFLAEHTGLPEEVFAALQPQCEGANEAFRKLVDATGDFDALVSEAIGADGRAHYLNTYDGHEWQEGEFYIYRTN